MQILFGISVASFLVIPFLAAAIVHHARRGYRRPKSIAQRHSSFSQGFSQHLLHAVENRDLRLPQEVRFQSIKEIAANKTWNEPSKLIEIAPAHGHVPAPELRKGPQPVRPRTHQRLDRAYFNKDSGDLTDPYQSRPVRKQTSIRRS